MLASRVYEGLQDWKKSEYFSAEATKSYPSFASGTDWYFWCRRTGLGDKGAAHELAEKSIELAAQSTYRDDADRTFTYRLLEGDEAGAVAGLDRQLQACTARELTWDKAWRLMHYLDLASQAKDASKKAQIIDEVRTIVKDEVQKSDPDWEPVLEGLCSAFQGKQLDEEFLARYDKTIANGGVNARCNYSDFMGEALNFHGLSGKAQHYRREAAFGGPFDCYCATLAGARLVKLLGPDRGGLPDDLANAEESGDSPTHDVPTMEKPKELSK